MPRMPSAKTPPPKPAKETVSAKAGKALGDATTSIAKLVAGNLVMQDHLKDYFRELEDAKLAQSSPQPGSRQKAVHQQKKALLQIRLRVAS